MTTNHTTPIGESVFSDLFPNEQAANLLIRAQLIDQLNDLLEERFSTQTEAAEALGVSQARISDLYRGKISQFTIDMLVTFLSRIGKRVEFVLMAAA